MLKLFRPPRWTDRLFRLYTWRFAVSDQTIFLTFDDGPHPDITPFVLDQLEKFGMKATFFCVGENMLRHPELVARIEKEGHRIGNHTMRHTKGTAVTDEAYFQSVDDFSRHYATPLFRPPYGRMRPSQQKALQERFHIIMWSWLSYDYDLNISIQHILHKARSIKSGDILVLHDNYKLAERQRELLPQLLQYLKSEGYRSEVIPL